MASIQPLPCTLLLKRYRRAAGLTQEELAEHAALGAECISALERGVNRGPRRATMELLAHALQLRPVAQTLARRIPRLG
jgi:transcriptional regulator with XRE-family HTH domain